MCRQFRGERAAGIERGLCKRGEEERGETEKEEEEKDPEKEFWKKRRVAWSQGKGNKQRLGREAETKEPKFSRPRVSVDFTAAEELLGTRLRPERVLIRWASVRNEERPPSVHFQQGWVVEPFRQ